MLNNTISLFKKKAVLLLFGYGFDEIDNFLSKKAKKNVLFEFSVA
ncbi:hypothetical protein VFMJ11_2542 [Aliivibrio fischeri MJ11]|uniref:Uncharacterized protein n=1 Tax=Aliivibrio fischeri (strain MJ11) TaxID=388396 RepID=B5FC96_ALIFM|nr:hypothetical protein VFMJ11_2542 [Aliivibrio fischeri MJ11]